MKPRRSLRRERLPLPLREGVGGRGPVPHDPSPRPPPSRGGGVSFLREAQRSPSLTRGSNLPRDEPPPTSSSRVGTSLVPQTSASVTTNGGFEGCNIRSQTFIDEECRRQFTTPRGLSWS